MVLSHIHKQNFTIIMKIVQWKIIPLSSKTRFDDRKKLKINSIYVINDILKNFFHCTFWRVYNENYLIGKIIILAC